MKLIKLNKIIILTFLIFSMLFNSYASLSSADGSTFVTKGEFDSAMTDVEVRLTTFEAGVNSKIDSQITSYLDRNGIWSGKDQGVNDKEIGYTRIRGDASKGKYGNYWHVTASGTWQKYVSTESGRSVILGEKTAGNVVVINNMSKSGLMMMGVYGNMYNDSDRFGIHVMMGNTAGSAVNTISADNVLLTYVEKVCFYQKTPGVTVDKLLNSIVVSSNCPVPGVASLASFPLKYLKFFVLKNSQLYVNFDIIVKDIATVGGQYYIGHKWYIKDAVIY